MSIQVKNIIKKYGDQYALDNISFEINKGEIVGFLGPNGAGKSTTMKILTCYVPPTSGEAIVAGHNVLEDPISVKKVVGYLPEHNPMYLDMYVKEYLMFLANIHKLQFKKDRVDEMIETVGLTLEQHKQIGQLSKGYRQRVGIAQALIHNPEVLILDEPTSGLDPNQLEDIRELIKKVGKEKTVMLSTHIMQEVEAICDRVIIINRGQLVANDQASKLKSKIDKQQIITVEFDKLVTESKLKGISGVSNVNQITDTTWQLISKSKEDIRPVISKYAQENGLLILSMQKEEKSLEDAFKKLTKK